jgi:hypothetical protein
VRDMVSHSEWLYPTLNKYGIEFYNICLTHFFT